MSETMVFPKTVEEFMEQYKIVDTEQVYTNGIELVPIFRMKQWFEAHKSEPLTDKEQRIFLAAMCREEKVCEEVDRNYVREPYEDSLMRVCNEIRRKVKGALWT